MTTRLKKGKGDGQRGSTLVEFALVGLLCLLLLVAFVELGRMILVYTSVANAARAGVRYAIVHGSNRTGSGVDGPSGPGENPSEVVAVVRNFAGTAPLDGSRLTATCAPGGDGRICVQYPDSSSDIGLRVRVSVVYRYDPLVSYFPLRVNLGSTSEGVIGF